MDRMMLKRILSVLLSLAMVLSCMPAQALRAWAAGDSASAGSYITTITDPATLTRPGTIYGDNTMHTGKITVGKSVSDTDITVNGQSIKLSGLNNFLVTISQSAQVMGLTSETSVPVDVVFVIDTSGSMDDNNRAETLVSAANAAIKTLMETNDENRVAVVAFSSTNYGGGTSGNVAANVLSSLAHYTGDAATNHLQWVNQNGSTSGSGRVYIAGRDTVNRNGSQVYAYRHGKDGGTNIQAGIVEGAKLLTAVSDTRWTNPETNETVTRIPFLIVISDGQPTYTYDDDTWYDPTTSGDNAAQQMGPGSDAYEGNGFVAAMTAAYYKGKITEHYYGSKANADNHCFVYTMGVEIDALTGDELALAQITLDPATYTAGSFAASNALSYYNYGNTANDNTQDAAYGWKTYWNNYLAGKDFTVRVEYGDGVDVWIGEGEEGTGAPNRADYRNNQEYERAYRRWYNQNYETVYPGGMYTFTATSIAASSGYVNGIGYSGGIAYNDAYFGADNVSDMQTIFTELLATIQEKAISVPTKVTSGDHNFDGYVNFYDPIGDYMEVKDMKGILANGYFFQGASFAEYMKDYGTANANRTFDALLREVLKTRMGLSASDQRFDSEEALDAFVDELLISARNSSNQADYTDVNDFDNSIVWWGNAYDSGEEDEHVQLIGFADNDSIEYIKAQTEANAIPAGADYVCRSYFFYGEAGGANPNPEHQYLYFVVRVQRELTAPYRQTVVISAPASLLSMEKVLIHESFDDNGNRIYTATVEHQEPARVVYEVGLWDSITEENVSYIVSKEYANEKVNGVGSVNYDASTDTYYFFSNDWDRSKTLDSHHRGMAKATFDAASDNPFYTYQQDTLIVDINGNAVTSDPRGTTAYYLREYYEWSDSGNDGMYSAEKKTILIQVDIPADTQLKQINGNWYVPKGTYTAATLVVNGDDVMKDDPSTAAAADGNLTGTSSIVAHPHRTGDASNSHYTVFLGNNGKLSLKSVPYEPEKTVSVNLADGAVTIVDDEGKTVQVGDVLTYTIEAKNILAETMDITVTDYIPMGTSFVAGSAGSGKTATGHTKDASIAPDSNNVLTWVLKDVPSGESRYVSFQVVVEEAAMSMNLVPGAIANTATVQIGNEVVIRTNTTHSAPYGKTVTDTNGKDIDGNHGFKVGDTLVYHIRFHNNAVDNNGKYVASNITVTDRIPDGTTFVSADNGGTYDAATGIVTWEFDNVAANAAKVVSFQVMINASAKVNADGMQPANGEIYLPNTATILIDKNPLITNTTENWADVGDMVISKLVAQGGDTTKTFTIHLTESSGLLDGEYPMTGGNANSVVFRDGKASVTIQHGQELTIQGLPAGVIISVAEDVSALPGWTPAYNTQSVTITKGAATAISSVSITNTYTREPLSVTVQGVKNMTGTAFTGGITFGFLATPDANNPEVGDPLTGEVTVNGNGEFAFAMAPKVFTQPGVYKYTISEINGGIMGVTYDGTKHVLEINVMDNGDGTMRASATLNGQAFDLATDSVPFSNDYTPKSTQLELTAEKDLIGRDLVAGEFAFQLTDGTNTYKGIHTADGKIYFETIVFTKTGVYSYTLSEVIPGTEANGIVYDDSKYTVVVTVIDENGQLVPSVELDGQSVAVTNGVVDTGVTFVNSFAPDDVPLTLVASKTLKVYDPATGTYQDVNPVAGQFRFHIVEKGSSDVVTTGTNAADGTITFSTFYFSADLLKDVAADANGTKTKTFTYVISEVVTDIIRDPNMLYDLEGREIAVVLIYTADGKLTVSVGGDTDGHVDLTGSANFINYGNPDSVTVVPTGKKTTNGRNLPSGLSFSFKVVPVDGTADAATGTSNATVGGADSETCDITFASMVYTHESLGGAESATYRYWIMESNAGAGYNGVIYDTTRYLYQVTLSRDAYGRLIATEQYFALKEGGQQDNAADYTVEVTNTGIHFQNSYEAQAHINLTADKILNGRTPGLAAGEFDFVLRRLDTNGVIVEGSEIAGYNDAYGVIHFATLNYSSNMLTEAYQHSDGAFYFSYLMSEIQPEGVAISGVTYDTSLYLVTIKVTQTAYGMTAELANVSNAVENSGAYVPGTSITGFDSATGDTNVTFINTYAAVEGDVVKYQIKKELDGRTINAGEFEFGLYLNGQLVEVAANDADGIVTFLREIPATAAAHAGVYEMVIRELSGAVPGVTYSTQEYTIYVKVTDNGQGKIEATVHLSADGEALHEDATGLVDLTNVVVFENTYKPNSATFTPKATKQLAGRDLIAGEFTFQAQLIHNGAPVTNGAIYQGINDADGNVVFQAISFTDAGTYIYKISELAGVITGVGYDTNAYYLKVEVTDDGNGYLHADGTYYADAACTEPASVIFRNTYTPSAIPVQLVGHKELIGRPMNDKEFSFVVHKNTIDGEIVAAGSNDAQGNILFSTFEITAGDLEGATSKTFTYVITESDNKTPGILYAPAVTVTVTVTNENGVLSAAISYPDNESAKFVNYYEPTAMQLPLVAYKTLHGKNLTAGEFTFELKDAAGNVIQSVTNDAAGVIRFENLAFAAADMVDADGNKVMEKTFIYTITEKSGEQSGMQYDTTVYTITITVTDDGKGNLHAVASYRSGNDTVDTIRFVNNYAPSEIEVELEGSKSIVDANGNPIMDVEHTLSGFEFWVYDVNGKLVMTATSDSDGLIKLSGFKFTAAGEYRFTIREKTTARPGYATDPTVWCAHITIGYDADKGILTQDNVYIHIAPESHEEVVAHSNQKLEFINTYDPADVTLLLKAMKKLDGRELHEHEFSFYMVDKATGLRAAESRNHANGEINFHLTYHQAGVYEYTIYEYIPAAGAQLSGVEYSTQTYDVTITVVDDGSGNLLVQVDEITTAGSATMDLTEVVVFNNKYVPGSVDAVVEAHKVLVGKTLVAGAFTFELKDMAGNVLQIATNEADGTVRFENMTFTAEDMIDENGNKVMEKDFIYIVSEKNDEQGGIHYDKAVYTVIITVKDDGQGNLLVEQKRYENEQGNTVQIPVFTNTYAPGSLEVAIEAKKILEGRPLEAGEFTFELKDESGKVLYSNTNYSSGDVFFEDVVFTGADMVDADGNPVMEKTFVYTISERNYYLPGVNYDEAVYTVSITIKDDGQGNLFLAQKTYKDAKQNKVQLPVFINTYTTGSVEATVEAQKVLNGKIMEAGAFTFELKDAAGKVIQTATNAADGTIRFENLVFSGKDMVDVNGNPVMEKKFAYTISEKKGELSGVYYDTAVYTVTITVRDNGKGELLITEKTYEDSAHNTVQIPEFVNVYTPAPVSYTPEVLKIYEGGAMRTFSFLLTGEGFAAQTKHNDSMGSVIFDALTFTKAGSYVFTIAELADPNMDDIHWDTNVYTLTIQVSDYGNGQLQIDEVSVTSTNGRTDLVFHNVHEEIIAKKEVFINGDPSINIDGQAVKLGDVLTYAISYTNFTGMRADVTITDIIPNNTELLSIENGGIFADGKLTWNVHLEAGESITVSFQVKVVGSNATITNQATILEGENKLETNVVTNPVPEDKVVKDVFNANDPAISIDGKPVQIGDILVYTITYSNSYEAAADVLITDIIPDHTELLSIENGGIFADGKLTWNAHLEAGESITVSFQVKVVGSNATITNQATILEGENKLETNVVTNPVPEDRFEKDVFYANDPTISIDGKPVQIGDILVYTLTYTNSYEAAADVVITDIIPAYTELVFVDNGGIFADGKLSWNVHLEAGESITVSFQVKVIGSNATITNQASALEGENVVKTNVVSVFVPEDRFEKDVFYANDPTISMDGKLVQVGDILVYTLTYTNSYEAAADVVITDIIPEHTELVSNEDGGIFADGKLTWNVHLEAGESITVSFQVKVVADNATITNQATALEGENQTTTNVVVIYTPESVPETGDAGNIAVFMCFGVMSAVVLLAILVVERRKNGFER